MTVFVCCSTEDLSHICFRIFFPLTKSEIFGMWEKITAIFSLPLFFGGGGGGGVRGKNVKFSLFFFTHLHLPYVLHDIPDQTFVSFISPVDIRYISNITACSTLHNNFTLLISHI